MYNFKRSIESIDVNSAKIIFGGELQSAQFYLDQLGGACGFPPQSLFGFVAGVLKI